MGKLEHLPFEFETAETMLHLLGPGVLRDAIKILLRARSGGVVRGEVSKSMNSS